MNKLGTGRKRLLWRLSLVGILSFSMAQAQTWEAIDDPEALTALFTDTVIEATLENGAKTVARYDRDGTGVVEAWGDKFQRTWQIRGSDEVCIQSAEQSTCYRLERDAADPEHYRAHNLATGEILELTIQTGTDPIVVDSPSTEAGGAAKPSAEEIARELANPNAPLASLTFKFQFRTFEGDLSGADDQAGTTVLFQPSFPFSLSNGDVVFFRPAIPLQLDQPVFDAGGVGFDSEFGLGDISFDLAYGRTKKSGILMALGVVSTLPTATDDGLGPDRWTLGPEILIGKLAKTYVLGAFPNHQWDIGGSGDADVSLTTMQLFGIYLPGGGWSVGTSPISSYNHETDDWTLPLNVTIGKTEIWNGRPWKLGIEINYFVEQPDAFGPEWMVGFSIAPVVNNVLAGWFK